MALQRVNRLLTSLHADGMTLIESVTHVTKPKDEPRHLPQFHVTVLTVDRRQYPRESEAPSLIENNGAGEAGGLLNV
jgi:hypothetical protein